LNNLNLSEAKLNALLSMAGKKLGQDPQTLKQQLQSGKLDDIMNGMDTSAKEKMAGLMNDPKRLEALMQDDKVKKLLSGLMGGAK